MHSLCDVFFNSGSLVDSETENFFFFFFKVTTTKLRTKLDRLLLENSRNQEWIQVSSSTAKHLSAHVKVPKCCCNNFIDLLFRSTSMKDKRIYSVSQSSGDISLSISCFPYD